MSRLALPNSACASCQHFRRNHCQAKQATWPHGRCGYYMQEERMIPIEQVMREVERATAKFQTWPTDPLHALAVLGEEYGELTKAMLQLTYEPHKTSAAQVREEAIQTAAMALRLVASLDRYEYRRCEQHEQAPEKRK